jgi:hypothetical protein
VLSLSLLTVAAILEELIEYSKKLDSDRPDSSAYLGRGRAYLKRGEIDKAIADFR